MISLKTTLLPLMMGLGAIALIANAQDESIPGAPIESQRPSQERPVLFGDKLFARFSHDRCLLCHSFYTVSLRRIGLRWVSRKNAVKGHWERVGKPDFDKVDAELARRGFDDETKLPGKTPEERARFKRRLRGDLLIGQESPKCARCHAKIVKEWRAPGTDLDWTGLNAAAVCEKLKATMKALARAEVVESGVKPSAPQAEPSLAEKIREHLEQDPRIRWSIENGRLPEERQEKPLASLKVWFEEVDAWVSGGMKCR